MRTIPNNGCRRACAALVTVSLAMGAWASDAPRHDSATLSDHQHARAEKAFQQGRFAEAYGRFVALANAGHAAAARRALWMCEHGSAHFGRDWDCGPHQVADWATAAGVSAPRLPTYDNIASPTAGAHGQRR